MDVSYIRHVASVKGTMCCEGPVYPRFLIWHSLPPPALVAAPFGFPNPNPAAHRWPLLDVSSVSSCRMRESMLVAERDGGCEHILYLIAMNGGPLSRGGRCGVYSLLICRGYRPVHAPNLGSDEAGTRGLSPPVFYLRCCTSVRRISRGKSTFIHLKCGMFRKYMAHDRAV